ncbi:unnamed protein product [Eruca vesicaria subsp. sativa]|uniref:Uncharacterized protein n=1 Tax=Eruca vesicaria subsp. sativa TaxID=29727 RepID=A0ABC8LVW0_ERUVS|nr:unnamed protein product [Eruca vesicaria subsp. sativa]
MKRQEADTLSKARTMGSSNKMGGLLSHAPDATRSWQNQGLPSSATHVLMLMPPVLSALNNPETTNLLQITKGGEELPNCLEELTHKQFVFKIRVTPYNFTPNHRSFIISIIFEYLIIDIQAAVG